MSNPVRPKKIPVVIGERQYHLFFSLNSFALLEDYYQTVEECLNALAKGSIKALRAVLYAGLAHEDPELTPEKVGELLTLADLPSLGEQLTQALISAMPEVPKNVPLQ
ncbi:hypothetical protein Desku_1110 [Desulfofundulus kuznetsovii DSM 6115]|uniref:Phage tail tube protein, GTA-gp10 n=1 Tax=Desulfofundulus kuznetsovii (strain DSM 6115 / VKM B-1805 / 17) TaxID=760568 RepID=A0AAU8PM90_DESK7|nr:hypothetical protein Desku_1110 [Desulfofundulus kuznetsovii DSM 6115]